MIVVGAGDLGRALAHYGGFVERGFRVVGVFDNDPKKIGTGEGHLKVVDSVHMKDKIKELQVKIAMLAVPAAYAQKVSDDLVESGIRAILNYAPSTLIVPDEVHVQYIDPVTLLQRMTYYLE
jgi:redox-sensing transcriptional repressor